MAQTDDRKNSAGNGTLYPLWNIHLPLDRIYSGGVTQIHVMEWADNGEISSIQATGTGGWSPDGGQSSSNTASEPLSNSDSCLYEVACIGGLIAALVLTSSYIFFKKRR
jgi:hypothetical protein